jgi:hypothetical protein
VNSAFNLWDLKGTDDGYQFLAKIAGFTVSVDALYRIAESYSVTLPVSNVYELPGGSGKFYTDLDPHRPRLDDLPLDDLPLDVFCAEWDVGFPSVVQAVTITGVTNIGFFGSEERYEVVVSTASMEDSYGTSALITDINGKVFEVLEYERIDSSSYQVLVQNLAIPGLGAATAVWSVFKRDLVLMGLGVDVEDLGTQALGFTGKRYRLVVSLPTEGPIEAGVWAFIDNSGVVFVVEGSVELSPTVFQFEVVGDSPPVAGGARLFYRCDLITSCDYCRATAIQFHISLGEIINSPESLADNPVDRVINRMQQMIPRHVRVASFIFSPGPALAQWPFIAASSTATDQFPVQALYSAYYDEDEFPADEIAVDSSPIVATSEVTITNENVLEEYIGGSDPIVAGTWTATGLWHVTEYRSSTQFRSFNYGQNDVGRVGEGGDVPPDYDGVADATVHRLTSPTFALTDTGVSGATISLRFRHFGDMRATGAGDDLVRVELHRTGAGLVKTISKATLGLTTGTNSSFTTYSEDISADVTVTDSYWLEFVYDEGTVAAGGSGAGTGEGWYVDDIEVQVTP